MYKPGELLLKTFLLNKLGFLFDHLPSINTEPLVLILPT